MERDRSGRRTVNFLKQRISRWSMGRAHRSQPNNRVATRYSRQHLFHQQRHSLFSNRMSSRRKSNRLPKSSLRLLATIWSGAKISHYSCASIVPSMPESTLSIPPLNQKTSMIGLRLLSTSRANDLLGNQRPPVVITRLLGDSLRVKSFAKLQEKASVITSDEELLSHCLLISTLD